MRELREIEKEIDELRSVLNVMVANGIPNHVPSPELLHVSQELDKLVYEHFLTQKARKKRA